MSERDEGLIIAIKKALENAKTEDYNPSRALHELAWELIQLLDEAPDDLPEGDWPEHIVAQFKTWKADLDD